MPKLPDSRPANVKPLDQRAALFWLGLAIIAVTVFGLHVALRQQASHERWYGLAVSPDQHLWLSRSDSLLELSAQGDILNRYPYSARSIPEPVVELSFFAGQQWLRGESGQLYRCPSLGMACERLSDGRHVPLQGAYAFAAMPRDQSLLLINQHTGQLHYWDANGVPGRVDNTFAQTADEAFSENPATPQGSQHACFRDPDGTKSGVLRPTMGWSAEGRFTLANRGFCRLDSWPLNGAGLPDFSQRPESLRTQGQPLYIARLPSQWFVLESDRPSLADDSPAVLRYYRDGVVGVQAITLPFREPQSLSGTTDGRVLVTDRHGLQIAEVRQNLFSPQQAAPTVSTLTTPSLMRLQRQMTEHRANCLWLARALLVLLVGLPIGGIFWTRQQGYALNGMAKMSTEPKLRL